MKNLIIIIFMCISFLGYTQIGNKPSSFSYGIALPNALQKEIGVDNIRIPVFDENLVIQGWVDVSDVGSTGEHNSLSGLQGGLADERYHLTEEQLDWILAQMYTNSTATLTIQSPTGNQERGVNNTITLAYSVTSNDDIITGAAINPGNINVFANVDTGLNSQGMGIYSNPQTFSLVRTYTRMGESGSATINASYTPHYPKWTGLSSSVDDLSVTDYPTLVSGNGFTKIINSSNSMSLSINNATPQYAWFISTVNTNTINEGVNAVTINPWGTGSSGFWKKSLGSFQLANGIDTVTMYLYRSVELINTGGNTVVYNFNP